MIKLKSLNLEYDKSNTVIITFLSYTIMASAAVNKNGQDERLFIKAKSGQ